MRQAPAIDEHERRRVGESELVYECGRGASTDACESTTKVNSLDEERHVQVFNFGQVWET